MRPLILAAVLSACAGDPSAPPAEVGPVEAGRPVDAALDEGLDRAPPDAALDAQPPAADPDADADAQADPPRDAAAPAPAVEVLALGPQPLDTPITLALDAPADGLLIQALGPADSVLGIVDAFGPGGRLIGPTGAEPGFRAAFNPGVAVALLPSGGGPPLPAGEYRFRVLAQGADAAQTVEVEAWVRRGPASGVRVNAWLPPGLGLALDDPALALFADALAGRMAAFGLPDTQVYLGLLGEAAPLQARLNGLQRDFSGLAELAAARPADAPPGLEIYLVDDILDGANRLNGFAGGLPAPVGHAGRPAAVTAVRAVLLPDFPAAVADFAQHELGHALGLFHTTEPFGGTHDPLADTLECPLACDADGDGVLFARECGAQAMGSPPCQGAADNVMFWTLGGQRAVTAGQRRVAGAHPLTALPP